MLRLVHGTGTRRWPRVLLTLVFGLLFAALVWRTAAIHGAPFRVDRALHAWALAHRPPWTVTLSIAVTTTGSGLPAYAPAAVAGALSVDSRRWFGALLGLLALVSAQLPRAAIARLRPPAAHWAWQASGFAMPSGHTTTSAVVAVPLVVAVRRTVGGRWRPWLVAAVVVWAVAVGASRVHLGVHWATDVLGGWLFAACWTSAAALVVLFPRRRSGAHPEGKAA
ncbi:MAG TPA: phosphatase PAP2 family protein [Umezawaea sp.]|nr:phosphatase PAP2 family protein [Umezawaea sp.]